MTRVITVPRLAAILLLTAVLLAGFAAHPKAANAQRFSDVPPGHTAYAAIEALASRGVIAGFDDGLFKPDDTLKRGQTAKILVGWKGLKPAPSPSVSFRDLDSVYRNWVETAAAEGLIKGYSDGSFKPYSSLTREQMAIIMVRALGKESDAKTLSQEQVRTALAVFKDAGSVSASARAHLALAVQYGLFSGDTQGFFKPIASITRAQFCLVVHRAGSWDTLFNKRGALAAFMDTRLFAPRNSPITGEMVIQNAEWYGIPVIAQLVILAAETALGDPKAGGELARNYNFGCLRFGRTDSPWGELSDGKVTVAGSDWYSFPSPSVGMMAFGRYLKAGVKGHYVGCLTATPIDWRRFASVYYGENVGGFEAYVVKLHDFEDRYRNMAAEHGLTL